MAIDRVAKRVAALMCVVGVSVAGLVAQTAIKVPKNRYTPQQDIELGREAAAEVRAQYPIIKDERIQGYLTALGDRLVAAAPADLKQPVYRVFVYAGEPQRDQRIRAAWRADVRTSRHVRCRSVRGRGDWGDGA